MPRKSKEDKAKAEKKALKHQEMFKKIVNEATYFEREGIVTIIHILHDPDCILFAQSFTRTVVDASSGSVFQPYQRPPSEKTYLGIFLIRYTPDKKSAAIKDNMLNKLLELGCTIFNIDSHKMVKRVIQEIRLGTHEI